MFRTRSQLENPSKDKLIKELMSNMKSFLEILQNSQENTCDRVSILIKLQVSGDKIFKTMCGNFYRIGLDFEEPWRYNTKLYYISMEELNLLE